VCCFYRPSILMCVPSCVRSVDQLSRHVQYSVNMSSQFTRTQKLSPVHSVLENSTPNTPSDVIWNNTGNFDVFLTVHHSIDFSKYQLNAQFLYSSTIYMLHYAHQHVSSSTLLIIRRTNCITTASGNVTLCKQSYSMRGRVDCSTLSTRILYGCLQRVTLPEAVVIQLVLLMMSSVLLETCWGA